MAKQSGGNATLTDKQEKFVQELIKGKSQREAYKAAYNAKNMSDGVIDIKASELFKVGKVRVRYDEIHDRLVKEAEDECIIDTKTVLKELTEIALDDIGNYLSFYTDEQGNVRTTVKDSTKLPSTRNISEVSCGKDGAFKFKMYCRDEALIQIGKILGMFVDKKEVKLEGNIIKVELTEE